QAGWNRVEQTALRHEHGQRNTFPRDVVDVLVIDEFEIAQEMKTGEPAIEKKTGNRETATPSIEGVERSHGREQADPDQARNKIDIHLQEQCVEEIDSGRVTKMFAEGVDWIRWPKPNAVGEKFYVSEVKAEIAQVHRRLNFQFGSVDEKQPAERADGENGEEAGQDPDREIAIFRCWRFVTV